MRVEEDAQVCGAIAPILAIVALDLSQRGRVRWRTSPMSWIGLSSNQTSGRFPPRQRPRIIYLRPLELACRMLAPAQKRCEFGALGSVEFDR